MSGPILLAVIALLAVFAPIVGRFDPEEAIPNAALLPPSATYWFGTDALGMDIFSRVVHAGRIDLAIAVSGTAIAMAIGLPLGVIAGYYAGNASEFLLRALDVLQAFPVLILATAIVTATRQGVPSIIAVIALVNAPLFLRVIRGEVLSLRSRAFVEAAQCLPNSEAAILWRHVLPNALGPAIVQATLSAALSLLITTALAFIGLGITPPTPEWGVMIRQGSEQMITGQWWIALFPGIAVALAIMGFNLAGDGLRRLIDPAARR